MARRFWDWLVRTGFRLLYHELAWTYDVVSWSVSLGEWRQWQLAAMPFVRGERVLEIAHGPGHMLLALAKRGYQVTGIDLSPNMSKIALRRLRSMESATRLVRGKAQALPFRAHAFETVLSTFPTNFVADARTMASVYRVLCPGGRYVIVPEGYLKGNGPLQRFIGWLYRVTGQTEGTYIADDAEMWLVGTPQWRAFRLAMEETGFEIDVQRIVLTRSVATVVIATRSGSTSSADARN